MLANDPVTQARIDLTTALRAAARHGLNEGVCNHFSMTVPGREDLFPFLRERNRVIGDSHIVAACKLMMDQSGARLVDDVPEARVERLPEPPAADLTVFFGRPRPAA